MSPNNAKKQVIQKKRKKVEQETSKSEQERLHLKAELKKTVKNIRQRFSRKYGKNSKLNAKVIHDPFYKEMVNNLYKVPAANILGRHCPYVRDHI